MTHTITENIFNKNYDFHDKFEKSFYLRYLWSNRQGKRAFVSLLTLWTHRIMVNTHLNNIPIRT